MSTPSSKPAITTLMPTYRRPRLLRRAIRSVLAQMYPDFQVCIFDNNSGDETAAVVQGFADADPRVKYFCNAQNLGMVGNFVQAMHRVDTPYYSFLNDDDFLLPDFYETAVRGLEENPDAAFSAMLTVCVDDQCRMSRGQVLGWRAGLYRPPDGLYAFLKNGFLAWTAILFRSDMVRTLGPLDPEIGASTDIDFLFRAAASFPFVVSDRVGSAIMMHPGSQGFSTRYESVWPALTQIVHKVRHDEKMSAKSRRELQAVLTKWHARMIFRWCVQFTLMKDFESAQKTARLMRELYGRKAAALLLAAIPRVCRIFPPAYWAGVGLNRVREALVNSKADDSKFDMSVVRRMFQLDESVPISSGLSRDFS
jgi:hypothetical protein